MELPDTLNLSVLLLNQSDRSSPTAELKFSSCIQLSRIGEIVVYSCILKTSDATLVSKSTSWSPIMSMLLAVRNSTRSISAFFSHQITFHIQRAKPPKGLIGWTLNARLFHACVRPPPEITWPSFFRGIITVTVVCLQSLHSQVRAVMHFYTLLDVVGHNSARIPSYRYDICYC